MIHKMIFSVLIAGLLGGYIALLYAFFQAAALIDHSFFMRSAM